MNKKGVSLVEVTIAALIFSIAAAGLFIVLSQQRQTSDRSERRLQAAYYAKQLLEELRAKVDQRNWNTAVPPNPAIWSNLNLTCDGNPYPWPGALPPLPGVQVNYTCRDIAPGNPGEGSRQVTLTIQWNEP